MGEKEMEQVIDLLADKLSRRQRRIDAIIVFVAERDPLLAQEIENAMEDGEL